MTPPKLTFGLPAYKAPFLREAIDSILAQSYTDFELVIVNDASPENLDEIVQSYSDERIRYYRNAENLGKKDLVSNWNLCLSYARGEYFVLASDDDIYHKDFAVKLIELLEKYPNVDLAHCRVATINAEKNVVSISGSCQEWESCVEFVHNRAIFRRTQMAPDFMCRTVALKDIGGFVSFPLAWYSDDATWFSLAKHGGVVWSSDILFYFRNSGLNISSAPRGVAEKKLAAATQYSEWFHSYISEINTDDCKNNQILKTIKTQYNSLILCEVPKLIKNESFRMCLSLYSFYRKKNVSYAVAILNVILKRLSQTCLKPCVFIFKIITFGLFSRKK